MINTFLHITGQKENTILKTMFKINKKVKFNNFGYLPKKKIFQDIYGKLFGNPNLFKRLQAPDIINVLKIKNTDLVLDLGCGSGFITVEVAKLAKKAIGLEISPNIKKTLIPLELQEKLKFIHNEGSQIPFEENTFDIILSSEVIAQIVDFEHFFKEIKRVLKPEGRLVLITGCGFPKIEDDYKKNTPYIIKMREKYGNRVPDSYEDFCEAINLEFSNVRKENLTVDEVSEIVKNNGFEIVNKTFSPSKQAGYYQNRKSFEHIVLKGKALNKNIFEFLIFIYKYKYFCKIENSSSEKYEAGLIIEAINQKKN